MLIKKFKLKDDAIFAEYSIKDGKNVTDYSLSCKEKALPSLFQALKDVAPLFLEICELPEKRVSVTGISLHSDENDEDFVLIGKIILDSQKVLNINTPYTMSEELDHGKYRVIDALVAEIKRYIKGERAQGELFGKDDTNGR